jgi:hypothetical protein
MSAIAIPDIFILGLLWSETDFSVSPTSIAGAVPIEWDWSKRRVLGGLLGLCIWKFQIVHA